MKITRTNLIPGAVLISKKDGAEFTVTDHLPAEPNWPVLRTYATYGLSGTSYRATLWSAREYFTLKG